MLGIYVRTSKLFYFYYFLLFDDAAITFKVRRTGDAWTQKYLLTDGCLELQVEDRMKFSGRFARADA